MMLLQKRFYVCCLVSLFAASCSVFKASSPDTSDFLPYPYRLVEGDQRYPFAATWVLDKAQFEPLQKTHKHIVVMPVETDFAEAHLLSFARSERAKKERKEELEEVATFLKVSFENALDMSPQSTFKSSKEVTPDSYILQIAITDLVPTDPAVNTLGTAAGFFLPGGGLIKLAGEGGIAIEGVLRDAQTKKVLMQFKDRETDKSAPFTVKDFEEYAHIREAIQDWAIQYAAIMAQPWDPKVDDSLPFTLAPF